MALKIKSISGIEDIVVSFADSANNVPATGIVGLETSGSITAIAKDNKLILSGEKQDILNFEYNDNDAISAINGSALAISEIDLSNYYTKLETSGKTEIANALTAKQNVIQSKKNSSLPYLETSNSEPSWEVIESEQINAHGTAQEGEVYNTTINGRAYTMVCLNGKLWLAENYVDEAKDIYTDSKYGSYFTEATIKLPTFVPQGWHLPSKEEYQELIDYTENHEKYLATTDWHTLNYHGNPDPNYIAGTNELKLNILPGGEYYNSTLHSNEYMARFWTNTDEIHAQSTGKQRIYARVSNYIGSTRTLLSFDMSGPGSQNCYNVRLIKDDLDVSGPDCWKTFKGKNFMAIADNEGNTFKDFYLKKVEAQATYQPIGSYASSAGVETLNTYYALTTTGWKDIAEGFYNKTAIDNSLSLKQDNLLFAGENNTITAINNSAVGITGAYVPLSAAKCTIGSGNIITTADNYTELAQGYNNTAKEHSFAQGSANSANVKSFAQGVLNSVNSTAMAQGDSNSGDIYSFMQGLRNSAHYASLAQGEANSAIFYSQAQGIRNYAHNFSLAVGSANSGYERGISLGLRSSAHYTSLAVGDDNWCDFDSFTLGTKCSASNKGLAVGLRSTAYMQSFAQGDDCSARDKGFAQGDRCYAYNYGFAQGSRVSANYYCALAQGYNVSANYDSLAQGNTVQAGETACAQGMNVTALTGSLAQGKNCSAQNYSLAQGLNNTAGFYSQAIGQTNSAVNWSTTIGLANTATNYSFAQGKENLAQNYSFAQGENVKAIGQHSHAEGYQTTAEGNGSHAEGQNTYAGGLYDHVEGMGGNGGYGGLNHIEGFQYHAYGSNSVSEFFNTNKIKIKNTRQFNGYLYDLVKAFTEKFIVSCEYNDSTEYHSTGSNFYKPVIYKIVEVELDTSTDDLVITLNDYITEGQYGSVLLLGPTTISSINGSGSSLPSNQTINQFTISSLGFPGNNLESVRIDNTFISISYYYAPVGSSTLLQFYKNVSLSNIEYDDAQHNYVLTLSESIEIPENDGGGYSYSIYVMNIPYYGCNHIEGQDNKVENCSNAHIEGYKNLVRSSMAHAEGTETSATNTCCHSEGRHTLAGHNYAHAEGYYTSALGEYAHSEGGNTLANEMYSHAEGGHTSALNGYSHAEGQETLANANCTHTEGLKTSALRQAAHAEGGNTLASGSYSHAEGYKTFTSGNYGAHAEGSETSAIALWGGHAEGYQSIASADWCPHAEGNKTSALNAGAHAEGSCTIASGTSTHAEGSSTIAIGVDSHTEGSETSAVGHYSHAEGNTTITEGENAHAEGNSTTARGDNSHAEGWDTIAVGARSHTEGCGTSAYDYDAHAEGSDTLASGIATHAEGSNTVAKSFYTHAEGDSTSALGKGSHAEGWLTIADDMYMHAQGRCNKTSAHIAFVIGNGNVDNNDVTHRSDAFIVDWNGVASAVNLKTSAGQVMTEPTLTAGKQYSYTTTGWHEFTLPEVLTISAENGITATTGTGADTGKIIVGIDTTNYKLLTTAEYNDLVTISGIVAANSARWVLTPAS